MSSVLPQSARNLLEAPLVHEKSVEKLGDALWLYVRLLTAASYRGIITRHIDKLAADLSVTTRRIEDWLKRLADAGLIVIESPAPFLVIKLGMWSDPPSSNSEKSQERSSQSGGMQSEVPVGSSSKAAAAFNHGDGGQGEGEEILGEILRTLDETDPEEFRALLSRHPAGTIRQALRRVATTPPSQIRKSKTALFRYLLSKLSSPQIE